MYQEAILIYQDSITELEYEVLVYREITSERNYGADADGNRGWPATFVDDEGYDFIDDAPKDVRDRFHALYDAGKLDSAIDQLWPDCEG